MIYVLLSINNRLLFIENHRLVNDNKYFVNVLLCISSRYQSFNVFQLFFNKIFNNQSFRQRRRFIKQIISFDRIKELMMTNFSKLIQITKKRILHCNDKSRSTYRTKNLQTKINLHFFRKIKNNEIRNNILRLIWK